MIDQLQRREGKHSASVPLRPGQEVVHMLIIDPSETLKLKEWAGTIPKQPLQAHANPSGNPHFGIERESALLSGEHLAGVTGVDLADAGEPAQHPHTDRLRDRREGFRCQCRRGLEAHGF